VFVFDRTMRRSDLILEPTLRRVFLALDGTQGQSQSHSPSRSPSRVALRASSPNKSSHRCVSPGKMSSVPALGSVPALVPVPTRAMSPVRMWSPAVLRPTSCDLNGTLLAQNQTRASMCDSAELAPPGVPNHRPESKPLRSHSKAAAIVHSSAIERSKPISPFLERHKSRSLKLDGAEAEEDALSILHTACFTNQQGERTMWPSNGWPANKAGLYAGIQSTVNGHAHSLLMAAKIEPLRVQTTAMRRPYTAWGTSIAGGHPSGSLLEPRVTGHGSWAAARRVVLGKSGMELARLLDVSLPPLHLSSNLSGGEGKRRLREFLAKNMARAQTLFARIDVDGTGDLDIKEMTKLVSALLGEQGTEANPGDISVFFDEFDHDGSGKISIAQFSKNLRSIVRRGSACVRSGMQSPHKLR